MERDNLQSVFNKTCTSNLSSTGFDKCDDFIEQQISICKSDLQQFIRNQVFLILYQIKQEIQTKVKQIDQQIKLLKDKSLDIDHLNDKINKIECTLEELQKLKNINIDHSLPRKYTKTQSQYKRSNSGVNLSQILFPFGNTFIKEPQQQKFKPLTFIQKIMFSDQIKQQDPIYLTNINPLDQISQSFVKRMSSPNPIQSSDIPFQKRSYSFTPPSSDF